MNILNTREHAKTEDGYVVTHPETNWGQVKNLDDGTTLQEVLDSATSVRRSVKTPFIVQATIDNQTRFTFEDPYFDVTKNNVMVHVTGEFMHFEEEYTVRKLSDYPEIVFTTGLPKGTKIHVLVERDTIIAAPNSGMFRMQTVKHTLTATTDNQKQFSFQDPHYIKENDSTILFAQSEPLIEDAEYSMSDVGSVITLTTGVPKGTKLHLIILRDAPVGDGSTGALTPEQKIKLDHFISPNTYYVDPVSGNDNNDGLSLLKAWRTVGKVNSALSNKICYGAVIVRFGAGVYTDPVIIENFEGSVIITGEAKTSKFIISEHFTFSNVDNASIDKMIISSTDELLTTSGKLILCTGSNLSVAQEVTLIMNETTSAMSVKPVGIEVHYGYLNLNAKFRNIGIPIATNANGKTILYQTDFLNCGRSLTQLGGTLVNSGVGTANFPGNIIDASSLSTTQVNEGIAIESGTTANGTYVKYGDGRMECYHAVPLTMVTGTTETNGTWSYPAAFKASPLVTLSQGGAFASKDFSVADVGVYNAKGTTGVSILVRVKTAASGDTAVTVAARALGRWK